MPVKITDNSAQIMFDTQNKISIINRLLIEDIHFRSVPVTPMKTGDLRLKVRKSNEGMSSTISWVAPYATYQESKQYRNYTTAGTGPHFAKKSVQKAMENINEQVRKVW